MTPGGYLRLRRIAAGLSLEQLPIGGTAMLTIERDIREPTPDEFRALSLAFNFDTEVLVSIRRGIVPPICRVCACTELDACAEVGGIGCHWVERDFCSSCAERARRLPEGLAV